MWGPKCEKVRKPWVLLWMNSSKLKLSSDKTDVMPVGSVSHLDLVDNACTNTCRNSVSECELNTSESISV